MLKRTFAAIGIIAGLAAVLAFLQWWIVRLQRKAAPPPTELLLKADEPVVMYRETPTRIRIEWQRDTTPVRVYLKDIDDTPQPLSPDAIVTTNWVTFDNLDEKQRYFAVLDFAGRETVRVAERTVPMDAVSNFRDIGGYFTQEGQQVRWNKIYRASALNRLTSADQQRLRDMHITFACDMRTEEEVDDTPDNLPDSIHYRNLPAHNGDSRLMAVANILFKKDFLPNLLKDLYTRIMLDDNPQVFTEITQLAADSDNLPLIIHCAAGKDRTGIATALILSLLGVDDETIIADYTLSNLHFDYFREAAEKMIGQLSLFGISESDFNYLLIADAQVMRHTLDHLYNKYGSAEKYLLQAGVEPQTITRIRKNLLY